MVYEKNVDTPDSKLSVKSRLLSILRGDPAFCFSGEILAEKLGVSRVAVWKAVNSLRAAAYPIRTEAKGYSWAEEDERSSGRNDFLYPWEFGERESSFYHLARTDSTMNRAAELAFRGVPAGTVVAAEEQTQGRGRNGHRWASGLGGLFFTLLERPVLNAAEYFRVSLGFEIAAARALSRVCGKEIKLRWPNDLYAGDRKIAGVLTEFHAEGDRLVWISLGIGVNVNNAPHSGKAANCSSVAGCSLSRQEVLRAVLDEWEKVKKEITSPTLHREWNALAWGAGKPVSALLNRSRDGEGEETRRSNGTLAGRGIFMGIDARGRGILKDENQTKLSFDPGLISFRFGG